MYEYQSFDNMYDEFLNIVNYAIFMCVPAKTVSLGPKDPYYITPYVKSLLIKRRKLRRSGRMLEADRLAEKINLVIADEQQKLLTDCSKSNPKDLWDRVNQCRKNTSQCQNDCVKLNADQFNEYFASISTSSDYKRSLILNSIRSFDENYRDQFYEFEIERLLRNLKNTSPGNDAIPCWVFKLCSYELAGIITYIINLSFKTGSVPTNWLTSVVTPIPKCKNPTISDFRPISVTPILSRMTEKLLVKTWIKPCLHDQELNDQFAYKNTGSTTCAAIKLIEHITASLDKGNEYVRCIFIDFSKAFDTIDHGVLISKLNNLEIPQNIKNWVIHFLTGRSQMVKYNSSFSKKIETNRGIVQGSAIGPYLYLILQTDLKTLGGSNFIVKYADDTILGIPSNSDVYADQEIENTLSWATVNKLTLNYLKTKEMVISKTKPSLNYLSTFDYIEIVDCFKYLGILIDNKLCFTSHVDHILSICNQRLYLLKTLKLQGLAVDCLECIFDSLIISKVLYCLPAWGGFLKECDTTRINALFKRAKRNGYTRTLYDFRGLLDYTDKILFNKMINNETHCLHHMLPTRRNLANSLRNRGHCLSLPKCNSNLYKNSFLNRSLFNFF